MVLTETEIRERLARAWDSFADCGVWPADVLAVTPHFPGPTIISDAPIGSFAVTLEALDEHQARQILGEARVDLHEGQRAAVTIEIRERKVETPAMQVKLAGTLFVHPAWGRGTTNLIIPHAAGPDRDVVVPSAKMQLLARPGLFRWDAGRVAPGFYVAYLSGCGANFAFDVGPMGRTDLELVVDEPALARVRVTDASHQAVHAHTMQWRSGVPGLGMGGDAEWDEREQAFDLRAPVGPVWLNVTGDPSRHQELEELVELHAGTNAITLMLAPPMGILLDITEGGTAIVLDGADCWRFKIRKSEPGAPQRRVMAVAEEASAAYRVLVPTAGTWEVLLPRTRRYEATSVEVEVPDAGFSRQQVALERRRRR